MMVFLYLHFITVLTKTVPFGLQHRGKTAVSNP